MANCQIEMRNLEAAADILKRCIATNDSLQHRTAGISDAEVRLKYCEVLTLLGKIDEADEMLVSVGYKDLREADTLPKPMIMKERERLLNILSAELQKFKEETTTETSPETTSSMFKKIIKKKN
ncbi:hypothetical protein IE077_003478 [Cardiosporidium cionae]|uniref:Uncharacterized protein n=1 Tax=Cardiosporidium cionae TaxID=476202 RepID=A0ABQ7J859_9APIC|nr:hypothetical protein IE077_003478 [Cardiosporidium cionae]|eukprot:KAF8820175.1 hypothetical protein IE077_003478 [Cardiosporidium cionae]